MVKDIHWDRESRVIVNKEVPIVEDTEPVEMKIPKWAIWTVLGMWATLMAAVAGEKIWALVLNL